MPADYSLDAAIEAAARAVAGAHRISAFTGAGMSAESGINTFRDPEVGVWKNRIGLALFGTPFGWNWMPGWAWSNYRRFHKPIFEAEPNAGHYALADFASLLPSSPVLIATQNVDSLHQRAGSPVDAVYEVHGSVLRHRCIAKGHCIDIPTDQPLPETPPCCPQCGSKARPDAVLFRESLPEEQWRGAVNAMQSLKAGDVLFVIGTSGSVQPAASLPDYCRRGVVKVELNAEESGHTANMDIFVKGPSAVCLPRILARAKQIRGVA